tara:strand:- start:5308 stop:6867 length:1560 start_codon:yes stop_codon:yes gene_type:complete
MYVTLFIFVTLSIDINYLTFIQLDLIKEISNTFSKKTQKNFIKFFTRKRPSSFRKDVKLFEELIIHYNSNSYKKLTYKGDPNYHAIRKRITKELINFLILENKEDKVKSKSTDGMLTLAKYFVDFKKYSEAWDLLTKEEKKASNSNDYLTGLKIQRLKLNILPYYTNGDFTLIKKNILKLQKKQAKLDEFQLYFIQMKNLLIEKIKNGDVSFSEKDFISGFEDFENLKHEIIDPEIHLKNIEIIRVQYAIEKNYNDLVIILENYYEQLKIENNNINHLKYYANIEYIMSYTYLEVREFVKSKKHLNKLKLLMDQEDKIFYSYLGRYTGIDSFVKVFDNQIIEGIDSIKNTLENHYAVLNLREELNLLLNLSALLLVNQNIKKANQVINKLNKSDVYYQENMGREWLLRKEMIRTLILIDLTHIDLAEKNIRSIKNKYLDLFPTKQYKMVVPFIKALEKFINEPERARIEELNYILKELNFKKEKVFRDPRLIMFFSWIKSKYTNKKTYNILLNEYHSLK